MTCLTGLARAASGFALPWLNMFGPVCGGFFLLVVVVPIIAISAEDEDRVGVPQWIDLWSDVDREPADHGGDQQQADRYLPPI